MDYIRVVSLAGLFGSGSGLKLTKISGLIWAQDILFVLDAQKHNQNNLATLLNFSDQTRRPVCNSALYGRYQVSKALDTKAVEEISQ